VSSACCRSDIEHLRIASPCSRLQPCHDPMACPVPHPPVTRQGLRAASFRFLDMLSPGPLDSPPHSYFRSCTVCGEHPEPRPFPHCNRKLEATWEAFWNALLKRLLLQSTLVIKTDNSVIKMFMHKGSIAVAHGNSLTWAF
jgi:hypothetical protein